jgi:hypothetical protein
MNGYHEIHLMLWAHFQYQTQSISVCGDLYDKTFGRKIVTTKHLVGRMLRRNIWSEDCYDKTFGRKTVTTKHLFGRLLRQNIWSEDCYDKTFGRKTVTHP